MAAFPVDSPRNNQLREQAQALADTLRERRLQDSAALRAWMTDELGAFVLDQFWLINALLVDQPLGAIPQLANLPMVISIEAERAGAPPEGNPGDPDTPGVARALIASDSYRNLGLPDNPIALIDTGVLDTHPAFAAPSPLGLQRDCVLGVFKNCTSFYPPPFPQWPLNPVDDCDDHGTAAAGLLSGNGWISQDLPGLRRSDGIHGR